VDRAHLSIRADGHGHAMIGRLRSTTTTQMTQPARTRRHAASKPAPTNPLECGVTAFLVVAGLAGLGRVALMLWTAIAGSTVN
jgi:hypothetical protein